MKSFLLTFSLGPLVQRAGDEEIQRIVQSLDGKMRDSVGDEDKTSIYSMALRTVIQYANATPTIAHIFATSLLSMLQDKDIEQWAAEDMEILTELIKRYGSSFSGAELGSALYIFGNFIQFGKGLLRRRALTATGILSRYLPPAKWDALITSLINNLSPSSDLELMRTNLLLVSVLSKSDPLKFRSVVKNVIASILRALSVDTLEEEADLDDDDDNRENQMLELREAALMALESVVSFQPNEAEPYLSDIILSCKSFINYDPNYIVNDDDDGSDANLQSDDEGSYFGSDLEGEEEFSDDEDQSWKLRRCAAKLTTALTVSYQKLLPSIFDAFLVPVVSRFTTEREDAVKIEWISTLSTLLSCASFESQYYKSVELAAKQKQMQGRRGSDQSILFDSDPQFRVSEVASKIIKQVFSEVEKKSAVAEYPALMLSLLQTLVLSHSDITDDIPFIVSHLVALLQSKPAFMIDALQLTKSLLTNVEIIDDESFQKLTSIIINGIKDSYFKVSSEALSGCLVIIEKYSHKPGLPLEDLQKSITEVAQSNKIDLETREKAVKCIGKIVAIPDLPETYVDHGCNTTRTLLSNEGLRLQVLDTIKQIICAKNVISAKWVKQTAADLSYLLNLNERSVRMAALSALNELSLRLSKISCNDEELEAAAEIAKSVSQGGTDLSDLQQIDLKVGTLNALLTIVAANSQLLSSIAAFALKTLDLDLSSVEATTSSASFEVNGAESLQQSLTNDVLALFESLVKVSQSSAIEEIYQKMTSSGSNTDLKAQVLGALLASGTLESHYLNEYVNVISDKNNYESDLVVWALTVYGYYGKRAQIVDDSTLKTLYDYFSEKNEVIRHAAAQSLGRTISHHFKYLNDLIPILLDGASSHFMQLVALNQAISSAIHGEAEDKDHLRSKASHLWDVLFQVEIHQTAIDNDIQGKASEVSSGDEQGLVAQCLGNLSLLDPASFLTALQENWKSPDSKNRSIALEALRCSFDAVTNDDGSAVAFDDILRPVMADVLALVEDGDVNIRQRALGVLVSAIHKQPDMLSPYLDKLLQYISEETIPDPSLIRTVQMGPFKHKVDGGLEVRKTAYEAIYTIVNTFTPTSLHDPSLLSDIVNRVIAGLGDEHEIKVLSLFIIGRLSAIDIDLITLDKRLDQIVEKLNAMISVTVKGNAIKQEFEKQGEITRNVLRASGEINKVISLARTDGSLKLSGIELQTWDEFYESLAQKYETST